MSSDNDDVRHSQGHSADSFRLTRPPSALKRVKTECSPNRLPSLRGPRDLTLGGIKKKTFTPNIPIRKDRAKLEVKEDKSSASFKKEKRTRTRDTRTRGRGRDFREKVIIQSHSIFEMRPESKPLIQGGRTNGERIKTDIQKPTIKKEKIDSLKEKADSEEAMKRLEEGNFCMIADLESDENLKPVVLPLLEPEDKNLHLPEASADVFRSTANNQMILLQIPDSLPGFSPSDDENTKSDCKDQKSDMNDRCSIEDLPEGKIGKLQIMKSGRCRLLIKGILLDVALGTPSSFAQEIASVRLPPEGSPDGSKGRLNILGEVSHKLVCVPDIPSLVNTL